jgi:hypothetical protein
MRTVLAIVAILVVVGTAALHYGSTRGEIGDWQPGRLPYPGGGFSSYDTFRLHRGGRFELQILSPSMEQEHPGALDDVASTSLHVLVNGPHDFHIDQMIKSVRVRSSSALGRTFSPHQEWVLPAGEYDIEIQGRDAPPPVFRDRGACIYLERIEPVGPDIGIQLSRWIGYFLLIAAALIAALLALRQPART